MSPLHSQLARRGRPLIAAHRGTTSGLAYANTLRSSRAAMRSGADIVELDVVASADGQYYAFHDGYESKLLGSECAIPEMTAAEISELRYGKVLGAPGAGPVEGYFDLLRQLGPCLVNVDRSWRYWKDGFLTELAQAGKADYLIVKSPVDAVYLDVLASCGTRFPYLAMVSTPGQIQAVRERTDINLVGFEVLPGDGKNALADPNFLAELKASSLLWLNALNLENLKPLFLGFDDEVSVFDDPDLGWGRLVDYGADIIQTDWPWLLRPYLDSRID